MLEEGPPHILFRERLRLAVECVARSERDVILDALREQNRIAAAVFDQPRHGRFLDRVRHGLSNQTGETVRDRDVASALGVSNAAMSNFRNAKETSSRVRSFFEAIFHWCYEPELHPRYVWLYTKLLTIERLYEPLGVDFGVFLQCHYLSRVYDDWWRTARSRGISATRHLANEATRRAAADVKQLSIYEGQFESRHLREISLADNSLCHFLHVGPWCLALDARIYQLTMKGSRDAV